MSVLGQDVTLLLLTNVALGVICALFWVWVLAAVVYEAYGRWRTRASLPRGWPPDDELGPPRVVIPDAWPPAESPVEH